MDVHEFERIKKSVADAEVELARSEGSYASMMENLKGSFHVKTLKEAQTLLEKKRENLESTDKEIDDLLSQIEQYMKGVQE